MIGCSVEKKSASGVRVSARRLRQVTVSDVRHGPGQAAAAAGAGWRDLDWCGDGVVVMRHPSRRPRRGRARPAQAPLRLRRRVVRVLVDRGLVPGQAQEHVVEAGLAQGEPGDGDLRRVERAQDLGADLRARS